MLIISGGGGAAIGSMDGYVFTTDLQPIVNNTPERAIVKEDRSKHCRSVVADQIATNRTINKLYDPL